MGSYRLWARYHLVLICVAVAGLALPALAHAQGKVTTKNGDVITVSVGARDGVKAGMRGEVLTTMQAGGKEQTFSIATFEVTGVQERTSTAKLLQVGENFQVAAGMAVRFSQTAADSTIGATRSRLWAPEPGRDPMFYRKRGDEELGAGRFERAEAYYRKVLEAVPDDLLAQRGLKQVEAGRLFATEASERKREAERRRKRVVEQLTNADYYLRSGDELFQAGDKAGAKTYWDKIAAVDPNYPGLPERMRKLTPASGPKKRFSPSDAEFTFIPAGTFQMGCVPQDSGCDQDEKLRHGVTISKPFWMMVNLVTVGQYRAFTQASGRAMPPAPNFAQGDDHPVVNVSWDDAVAYCTWAGGRLPTEAEWEYAARGGKDGMVYPWGNTVSHDNANYDGTGGRDGWVNTSPVGSFEANGFGLFDMAGNVWEWCSPSSGSLTEGGGSVFGIRGGSWYNCVIELRTSRRLNAQDSYFSNRIGFRCIREVSD